jgi:hypothetical protein
MTVQTRALIACWLALCGFVIAQQIKPAAQSKNDPIQITGLQNAQLRFQIGRSIQTLDLRGDLNGCTSALFDPRDSKSSFEKIILSPRVLDEVLKAGFWYVTLQINLNGGCNVQGYCGAGSVTQVLWFKFDRKLKAITRKSVTVSDCATNIELLKFTGRGGFDDLNTELEMRGGLLELSFQKANFNAKINTVSKLRYDRRQPENGLVISTKTFKLK